MTPEDLSRAFARNPRPSSDYDLNPGHKVPPGRVLRAAAVLIAIEDGPSGVQVILTKRASGLKHHPGQIALPGGKLDPCDATPEAAALREASEEIGLPPTLVNVLGRLPCHETVTGFNITPVIGHIRAPFDAVAELGEVDEVFRVPLAFLLDLQNYRVERRLWRGVWRNFYTVPYGPYYIWGATARILRGFAERMA